MRGVAGPEKAGQEEEEREHREGDDAEQEDFDIQLPRNHAIGTEQVEGAMHRALGIRFDGHGWQWWCSSKLPVRRGGVRAGLLVGETVNVKLRSRLSRILLVLETFLYY